MRSSCSSGRPNCSLVTFHTRYQRRAPRTSFWLSVILSCWGLSRAPIAVKVYCGHAHAAHHQKAREAARRLLLLGTLRVSIVQLSESCWRFFCKRKRPSRRRMPSQTQSAQQIFAQHSTGTPNDKTVREQVAQPEYAFNVVTSKIPENMRVQTLLLLAARTLT